MGGGWTGSTAHLHDDLPDVVEDVEALVLMT